MKRWLRRWAGRAALVALGIVIAAALLEGLLRLGGLLYRPGPADGAARLTSAGSYRVLCLGESTTAGIASGVEAYPTQLERILNDRAAGRASFEVINRGRPGTTTDVIVARLPELLDSYEPDIVVTMMGVNDGHLVEPAFQIGGSLRVWKLIKTLYYTYRKPPAAERAEELLLRAEAALEHSPDTAAKLATEAHRLVPDDPRGTVVLAEAQVMQDRIESAAESYQKAIDIDGPSIVAYAFEVEERFIGVLDWVLSRLPRDTNALAARAALALRRRELAGAEYFSRRATEIDPDNAAALLLHGRALQLSGSTERALRRFETAAATSPRLVGILATDQIVGSRELFEIALREGQRRPASGAQPPTTAERWFLRSRNELDYGLKGLHLEDSWERIARGENEEAARSLRALAGETEEDVNPRIQLRAHGQLAILAWQRGDAAEAEQYHQKVESLLEEWVNATTAANYRALWQTLHDRGIPLVAVQYPMRRLAPLERLLAPASDMVYVDNERVFKDALLGRPYSEIFYDLFAGDFGHMTVEGNRLLADSVADAVLGLVPEVDE